MTETSTRGAARSAILLRALGEEEAAAVLRLLPADTLATIVRAIARLGRVRPERLNRVLEAFEAESSHEEAHHADSRAYVSGLLHRAFGAEDAGPLIEGALRGGTWRGGSAPGGGAHDAVATLLAEEHPQVVASILVHLQRRDAAAILAALPRGARADVLARVATLEALHPAAIEELEQVLRHLPENARIRSKTPAGGVAAAAEILEAIDHGNAWAIVESLAETDPALSRAIAAAVDLAPPRAATQATTGRADMLARNDPQPA